MSHLRAGAACQRGDLVCIGAISQLTGGVSHSWVSLDLPAVRPANDQVPQQRRRRVGVGGEWGKDDGRANSEHVNHALSKE